MLRSYQTCHQSSLEIGSPDTPVMKHEQIFWNKFYYPRVDSDMQGGFKNHETGYSINMKQLLNKLKINHLFLLAGLLVFISCEEDTPQDIVISTGTSFGECAGYCIREMVIAGTDVSYTASGWDSADVPELSLDTSITSAEWNTLEALADLDALESFDDVVGCPDCADGGAEWIKISDGVSEKKVTFEYGDTLAGFEDLIGELRALRQSYETRLFHEMENDQLDSTAIYTVEFEATWSDTTHPSNFPPSPHFSGLIGASHNDQVAFWNLDTLASTGMKDMAELGSKDALTSEIEAFIVSGEANQVLSGGYISPSPGSVSYSFTMSLDHPLVTLVSMLAPSPDWFVGVSGLDLTVDGQWLNELTVPLYVYDAGTDSGPDYTSANMQTRPPENISMIEDSPFMVGDSIPPVGTFYFQRILVIEK
ncbi:MAG: spondin domain-containing protein [Candidatus Marinimicrobia bacterium]|nr:spondin domain-containing protein [Candidatus Neomarinimicrobiota bacterium]MCF7850729.1 spondin domain-containing protein [Candidatus Neomarinimicrobiota bacterium]